MNEIVKLINITKTYGKKNNKVHALKNINLEIEKGSFVTIIGQSGSGKSTLLHILGGLDKPDSGTVIIGNHSLYELNDKDLTIFRRRNIGFVFQFFNLVYSQNVYENIVLPLYIDGKEEDKDYINDLLNTLGIENKRKAYIDELSGGQQQRVAIARALATKPDIILLDEPTGNLDSTNTKEIIELLKLSQVKYNQTIVMVTHDNNLTKHSDRIITIDDGMIVGDRYVQ